jgi:long-chain acyl-CoA synthetase
MARSTLIPKHINSLADYIEETFTKYAERPAYSALGQEKYFQDSSRLGCRSTHP